MESSRWKNASLAINAIIRGLEHDQIAFFYDEAARREIWREGARSELQTDVPVAFSDNDATA
jgi:hypothetical protein